MKNGNLNIPQVQDSVIGGFHITQKDISFDLTFVTRLNKFGTIDLKLFNKKQLSGAELVSLLLPIQNFRQKTSYYDPSFEKYIEYDQYDKQLVIELGQIKSGYFDNASNNFYKQIYQTKSSEYCINTIYSIQ